MHKRPRNPFRFDRRHVAGHALASSAALLVMRMLFQRRRVRAVRGRGSMAVQADLIRRLSQLCIVFRAVYIVA